MLCKLHSTSYAIFFLQQLLFLQWLGSVEMCREKLLLLGYTGPVQAVYNGIGSGRSLASVCLLYVERLVQQVFELLLKDLRQS
jgi:hypothetical protein